jgi:putative transposase
MAVLELSQAYRFALDPSSAQERMLPSHAGAARFAWNWALVRCRERYAAEARWYSANRRKSAQRLARIHARVANVRADALHKATTSIAANYETVMAENLNVAGMIRNRRLARAIADQGFGAARRMLGYKTTWNGGDLILADRWYPSSKTCSGCGTVKAKLALSERLFACESCGLAIDRDQNAATNLRNLAVSGTERLNACGAAVRPGQPVGPAALKQELGTANAGKARTVARQQAAAGRQSLFILRDLQR